MFGIGPIEAALLMVPLWLLPLFVVYWIIRLGVRHGAMDAHKRLQGADRRDAVDEGPRSAS
jgi:hypothetical protein